VVQPLKPAKSSLIHSHGYDAASRTLALRFVNSDKVYHYKDVPPEDAARFEAAESVGKHFGQHIRGKFEHTVITAHPHHSESTT
jgi:hypothetical protein